MMTKRLALLFALAVLAVLLVPALAFANMGPHGSYLMDTDACAGCHRAHTAASTITWADNAGTNRSALAVTTATTMLDYCYACHDATSQGADTNVQQGIYEGTLYGTTGGILNGGGFESVGTTAPVTSTHVANGSSWGAYGGGYNGQGAIGADGQYTAASDPIDANVGESVQIKMDCDTCHDPHGSSNYRALKAYANGNYVGGYIPVPGNPENPTPDPFVWSNEEGYPAGGFALHTRYDGTVPNVPGYVPNYTEPLYAKGYTGTALGTPVAAKGMSGWCVGCHSTYMVNNDGTPWSGATQQLTKSDGTVYNAMAWVYNAGDGGGLALRHKHPINTPMSNYNGPDKESLIVTEQVLPLAKDFDPTGVVTPGGQDDWVECLTCHRAHGTSAIMTGFATLEGSQSIIDTGTDGLPHNVFPASEVSALLRLNNRGVCETCHNK